MSPIGVAPSADGGQIDAAYLIWTGVIVHMESVLAEMSPAPDAPGPGPKEALESLFAALGPFGLYQGYALLLLCLPNLLAPMYSLNYVFVAERVPFRCVVPECEGLSEVQFQNPEAELLLAENRSCDRLQPLGPDLSDTCDVNQFALNETIACEHFVYESFNTIYAEFGLACREHLRTLVGTVRNAALPLALILTGFVSDTFGRRVAFGSFSFCAGALGLVKSFAPSYVSYLCLEFLEAALGYGFASAAYVLLLELAPASLRVAFASASGVAYGLGGVLFAALAYAEPRWRWLLRLLHAPALLLPLAALALHESPRWLLARGRPALAERVLRTIAKWNRVKPDEALLLRLHGSEREGAPSETAGPWRLLRSRALLLRFGLSAWCWVAAAFVYSGLTINAVALAGERHLSFGLSMGLEVVASLLLAMALERFGRRRTLCAAFLGCGLSCALPFFVGSAGVRTALFFAGKLSVSLAFNALYVFSAELFPTGVRSSALAALSLVGRLGSVLAPQTPLLGLHVQALLYGASSLLAALAVLCVPETKGAALPQDAADAEAGPAPPPPPKPLGLS